MKTKKTFLPIIILFILIVLIFSFNFILQSAVTAAVGQLTGAPVSIGKFNMNLFKQEVSIKNFILYNPPGFPDTSLIDIPEVTVAIKAEEFWKGKLHLPLVVVNLREMNLVKNKEGKLNVDSLKFVQNPQKEKEKPTKDPQKNMPFKIERLKLTIGKVVFYDYSGGGDEPRIKDYNIRMENKEFKNITSPQQLATLLLVQSMGPTAIRSVAVNALSTVKGLETLTVDTATGLFNSIKEKLK